MKISDAFIYGYNNNIVIFKFYVETSYGCLCVYNSRFSDGEYINFISIDDAAFFETCSAAEENIIRNGGYKTKMTSRLKKFVDLIPQKMLSEYLMFSPENAIKVN